MFRRLGRAGRVIDEAERSPEKGWMFASSDLKFVIFRDMKDCYRWRLTSVSGETVEYSERGHLHKGECERDVYRLKDDKYPYAKVRDAAIG
jgi:uncharacterized protein YegP (UPF0339 family)